MTEHPPLGRETARRFREAESQRWGRRGQGVCFSSNPPAADLVQQVERTRAYLGGDATHSILVKGLDYALLAARKAELEREGDNVADDELDALLKEGGRGRKFEKSKDGKTPGKEVKAEELNNRVSPV